MQNIIIPLSGTFRPKGGLTSSVLKKASSLADQGHNVVIVTFRFRLGQGDHEKDLVDQGLVSPNVIIRNFHESLAGSNESDPRKKSPLPSDVPTAGLVQKQNRDLTRYFTNQGDLLYTELLMNEGFPHILRRYYNLKLELLRIDELDIDRNLQRVRRYMPGVSSPLSESLISKSGEAYLTHWYRPDGSVRTVIDHSRSADDINPEYSQLAQMQAVWFKRLVTQTPEAVLLIDDPHSFDVTRHALSHAKRRILTLHSNTFNHPDDVSSGLNVENSALLGHIEHFERVVVSTEAQRRDLTSLYADQIITTIPQLVAVSDPKSRSEPQRDKDLFVYVGRLEKSKQLNELLIVISTLFESNPSARLEIYGEGSEESTLRNTIERLGLGKFVKLMGRTQTPMAVLSQANLSILPTKFEGFGITIAESMLMGTPVVAFDCRYGPGDMIEDKVSGRLIPPQDFNEFVSVLKEMISNPILVENMRMKAVSRIEELCNAAKNIDLWNSVVDNDLL